MIERFFSYSKTSKDYNIGKLEKNSVVFFEECNYPIKHIGNFNDSIHPFGNNALERFSNWS
jgi:hypothetical protein